MDPTVAACQCRVDDLDVAANLDAVAARLAGLPDRVDVAVFSELVLTGFVADARPVDYAGRSLVVRPDGVVAAALAHAPDDLVATLDPAVLADQRDLVGVSVPDGF